MKKVEFYHTDDVCVIKPSGEMTFFFLEEVNNHLKEQIKGNRSSYVYDMSSVTWIDSIGLGLIAMTVRFAMLNQRKVCIVNPRENVVQLLRLSSLLDLVEVCTNVEEAVNFFKTKYPPQTSKE
jgi:anti-anti-sigma factor